jgi:hypothetical protein
MLEKQTPLNLGHPDSPAQRPLQQALDDPIAHFVSQATVKLRCCTVPIAPHCLE